MDFPARINFQPDQSLRIGEDGGTVLAVSGSRTRNKDFWSGKDQRIIPSGVRLEPFNRNPILLWMHHMGIPLGNVEMYTDSDKVWAHKFRFHRKEIPLLHEGWASGDVGVFDTAVIADLWEEFVLNAVSISLMIGDQDVPNIMETDDEFVIGSSEALELSVVTIPADREALRQRMVGLGVEDQLANAMTCKDGVCHLKLYNPGSISLAVPVVGSDGRIEIVSFNSTSDTTEGVEMDNESARRDDVQEVEEFDATEEEIEEAEEESVEAAEVVEEVELEVDMDDVVNAIVSNAAFAQRLVALLSSNDEFISGLAEAVSQSIDTPAVPTRAKLKFAVNTDVPSAATDRQAAKPRTESFSQEEAAPAPKRNTRILGLVKPRI